MDLLNFYEMNELPFNNSPDTKYFYSSEQHEEALLRLWYLVQNKKGLGVVTGAIGTGKTTLARLFFDELDSENYEPVLMIVVHSEIDSEWILKRICSQLDINEVPNNKPEMLSALFRRLNDLDESGKKVVVLIDEAQMLKNKDVMEEIRGILNFEDERGKLLTFILFGLPEVEKNLAMDEPLRQRVALRYHLKHLTFEGTKNYILHRMKVSGAKYNFFSKDSFNLIHEASKGIPRVINTICDNAMFESYLIKKKVISKEIIQQVVKDLNL